MAFSVAKSASSTLLRAFNHTKYGKVFSRSNSLFARKTLKECTNNCVRSVGCWYSPSEHITSTYKPFNISNISQYRLIQTKGDKELSEFLQEEIQAERNLQKSPGQIPSIPGFEIKFDEADVILTKAFNGEKITVTFNVNNTVDADDAVDDDKPESQDAMTMKSRPDFIVSVEKSGKTLAFNCAFVDDYAQEEPQPESFVDMFNINEIFMYEKEAKDKTYSVSAEIMDGDMYNLLMNYLEERGVSNDFAQQLSVFSSSYEHKLYINLLESLKSFISK